MWARLPERRVSEVGGAIMLKLMYITNDTFIARTAAKSGVGRIFIDMEILGKRERQRGMDTVQSRHVPEDIARMRGAVGENAEIMARVNPLNPDSRAEIDAAIENGADVVMLPMWRTAEELRRFVELVGGRARTMPLLETAGAVDNLDETLRVPGIDEIHIGLNDLHLSYHMKFIFQPLADGMVERLCGAIRDAGIPYGFGGVGRPGSGALPAEYIIGEHCRLGSGFVILSRSFCDAGIKRSAAELEELFFNGVAEIRRVEAECAAWTQARFEENRRRVRERVGCIVGG